MVRFDPGTQQIELSCKAPACVVHALTPILISTGTVEGMRLARPLVTWSPPVPPGNVRAELAAAYSRDIVSRRASSELAGLSEGYVRALTELLMSMTDPGLALPYVPMGAYVEFTVRTSAPSLLKALQESGMSGVPGAPEFVLAAAGCLSWVLEQSGDIVIQELPANTPRGL